MEEKLRAKKSLGQHFLKDKNILKKIADTLGVTAGDLIIEIGPGEGALTEYLLIKEPGYMISIEIDQRAVSLLQKKSYYKSSDKFEIIHSDIREIKLATIAGNLRKSCERLKIAGNIPYNISADILFWIFDQSDMIDMAVLMLQKEVALRIVAKPSTKAYGILSIAANLKGSASILFDVSPECFEPKPKVLSSVIKFIPERNKYGNEDFRGIMKLVKSVFNQRRKTLRNNLKRYCFQEGFDFNEFIDGYQQTSETLLDKRPEDLNTEDYIDIYKHIQKLKKQNNFEKFDSEN